MFNVEMDVLKMYSFCCSLGVITIGAIQNFVLWLIIDTPSKSAWPILLHQSYKYGYSTNYCGCLKWTQHVIILWKILLRNWSILFIIGNWEYIHTSPYRLNHLKESRCGKLLPELPFIVWHSLTSRVILTVLGYHCHMFDSLSLSLSFCLCLYDRWNVIFTELQM
jgi:hypothetical protein